jgi:hypothetical protein
MLEPEQAGAAVEEVSRVFEEVKGDEIRAQQRTQHLYILYINM